MLGGILAYVLLVLLHDTSVRHIKTHAIRVICSLGDFESTVRIIGSILNHLLSSGLPPGGASEDKQSI